MADNDGSYMWAIDDAEVLNKIFNAKNGEQFVSDEFEIGEIRWKIDIRPNGISEQNIGSFLVFLKLIKLPQTWRNVVICRTISSPQTKSSVTKMAQYAEGDSFGWKPDTLLLKDIKGYKLDKFIIKINIKMLEIRLKKNDDLKYHIQLNYDKKQQLKWTLDTETLHALKKSNYGKCSSSNIFNGMWVIEVYPNGDDKTDEGKFNIDLRLCALPKNVSKFDIKWTVSVKQFDFKQSEQGEYTLINPGKILTAGSFEEFLEFDNFEIIVDILVVGAQQIQHLSLTHLDRYMITAHKHDFREETLMLFEKKKSSNNNDKKSIAVQFEVYQKSIDQQIKTLKKQFTVKAEEMEKLMNENNINGQDIDNVSNSEWEQKQNELSSYQTNIDDRLSSYNQQIISLKDELNTKTQQIQKLSDVNHQNQQEIKSLVHINRDKGKQIKIINDKLKQILDEEKKKKNDKDKDMMIEINKLKQEISKMREIENNKKGMGIMRKIRIGFGTMCLIGGVGYIAHCFGEKNKASNSSSTTTTKGNY